MKKELNIFELEIRRCNRYIALCIVIIIFLLALLFYNSIYVFAKASTDFYYGEVTEEELKEKGIYLAGSYYPSSGKIEIIEDRNGKSLKHEHCHFHQAKKGRLYTSCDEKNKLLMNEIECKISEYLPMFIYKKIYGNI